VAERALVTGGQSEHDWGERLLEAEEPILDRIGGGAPVAETLAALTRLIETFCPGTACTILRVDREGKLLRGSLIPGADPAAIAPLGPNGGVPGLIAESADIVITEDIAGDASWDNRRQAALEAGFRACWSVPVRSSTGIVLGVLVIYLTVGRQPCEQELKVVRRAAKLASVAAERDRARQNAHESDLELRSALDAARLGTWEWDIRTGRVNWSPTFEAFHGLAPGSVGGTIDAFLDHVHPADRQRVTRTIGQTVEQQTDHRLEYRLLLSDGNVRWVEGRGTFVRDERGEPAGLHGVCLDITEHKQAEERLRNERERYRVMLTSIGDAVIATDRNCVVEFMNPAAESLTGWTASRARGKPLEEVFRLVNDSDATMTNAWVGIALREGAEIGMTSHHVLRARDGTECLIDDSVAPIVDGIGQVVGAVLVFRDVDQRRKAEQAIRESERRLRQLADTMPQIVWTAGPDGTIDYFNGRWYEYTGLTRKTSLTEQGWRHTVHPDDEASLSEAGRNAVARGEGFELAVRVRDHAGHYRWHLVRSVPVRDDAGAVVSRFGTATEIDEQIRAERNARFLAEASATLATLVDETRALQHLARIAVPFFADCCVVDMLGDDGALRRLVIAHVDESKVALIDELERRYPTEPGSKHGAYHVVETGRSEIIPEITDAMLQGGAKDAEHLRLLRAFAPRSHLCVPLTGQAGTIGAISFSSGESGRRFGPNELRLAEDLARRAAIAIDNARLYSALKLADRRKDEFLATLAHELRNPLAPIRNALHLLERPDPDAAVAAEIRGMIRRQIGHITRLVDDLLDVSRITRGNVELRKENVDLARVLHRAIETVRPLIEDQGHDLSVTFEGAPIVLEADPTRLEQVFDNLLHNAAKYTDPGGRIMLTAARDGPSVVVRVRDTGIGIAADELPRVFDLFMQAERRFDRAQGGLGIGLSLVRSLVDLHGGSITAQSDGPGHGSEFTIRLPALPASATVPPVTPTSEPAPIVRLLPRRRVLVVDDNLDAARTMAMLLRRAWGQDVEVAHDGLAAVEAAQSFQPDVILLDIGLPRISGYEVARRLRAQPAFARTLLVAMTGWGQEEDQEKSRKAGFDHHMVKPVDPEELRKLLAAHHDQGPA
jgi:PAS domain S-box-containing protein